MTEHDDLVQFLRDRLDEDEAAARRAGDSFRQIGDTGVIVATEGDRAEECATANWSGIAEHIVRHDPARVLAQVAAHRRLVDSYAAVADNDLNEVEYAHGYANALGHAARLIALAYADHPKYKQEWRP